MKTGKCSVCGRTLTNPESIARGMGPVCYRKYRSVSRKAVLSAISCQQVLD